MAKKKETSIEVNKPETVEVKKIKATPKRDIGSKPKYKAGVEYEFTEEQIKILTKNKDI